MIWIWRRGKQLCTSHIVYRATLAFDQLNLLTWKRCKLHSKLLFESETVLNIDDDNQQFYYNRVCSAGKSQQNKTKKLSAPFLRDNRYKLEIMHNLVLGDPAVK